MTLVLLSIAGYVQECVDMLVGAAAVALVMPR